MELLESNLSRDGVEELEWAKGPLQVRDERIMQVYKFVLAFISGPLAITTGFLVGSIPIVFTGGFLTLYSLGMLGKTTWDWSQVKPYLNLWLQWKEESAIEVEVDRIKRQLQELKNSSYTGPTTTWFSSLFTVPYHLVKDSAIRRDGHWQNLCDDLASAVAQVGTLSVQSDRAHNFRSHLLYVIRKSAETLSIVAENVTDSSSWLALLERKYEIAYLLSWMREPAPVISDSYPSSLGYGRFRIRSIEDNKKEIVHSYKIRLDALIKRDSTIY